MGISREDLKQAFEEFVDIRFPADSANDDLGDFHADLADYDGYIAGLVQTLIRNRYVPPKDLQVNYDMRIRLETIKQKADQHTLSEVSYYTFYMDAIERLLAVARDYSANRENT